MERDEDDRLKAFAQLEQIHSKYTGTGHPSISRQYVNFFKLKLNYLIVK